MLVFYTLAGFFLTPWRRAALRAKIVQEQLKKQAAIGEVRINPFIFTVEANDFRMEEPMAPIVGSNGCSSIPS